MIMVRALYKDFSRYNRVATDEEKAEDKEETGWKLVHADVFRPPTRAPLLFACTIGVGTQILGMSISTVFFAAVGFLNPANRGSLMVGIILLFLFMGAVGGYEAARTHKVCCCCCSCLSTSLRRCPSPTTCSRHASLSL